jgi:hypothetical protein
VKELIPGQTAAAWRSSQPTHTQRQISFFVHADAGGLDLDLSSGVQWWTDMICSTISPQGIRQNRKEGGGGKKCQRDAIVLIGKQSGHGNG